MITHGKFKVTIDNISGEDVDYDNMDVQNINLDSNYILTIEEYDETKEFLSIVFKEKE